MKSTNEVKASTSNSAGNCMLFLRCSPLDATRHDLFERFCQFICTTDNVVVSHLCINSWLHVAKVLWGFPIICPGLGFHHLLSKCLWSFVHRPELWWRTFISKFEFCDGGSKIISTAAAPFRDTLRELKKPTATQPANRGQIFSFAGSNHSRFTCFRWPATWWILFFLHCCVSSCSKHKHCCKVVLQSSTTKDVSLANVHNVLLQIMLQPVESTSQKSC